MQGHQLLVDAVQPFGEERDEKRVLPRFHAQHEALARKGREAVHLVEQLELVEGADVVRIPLESPLQIIPGLLLAPFAHGQESQAGQGAAMLRVLRQHPPVQGDGLVVAPRELQEMRQVEVDLQVLRILVQQAVHLPVVPRGIRGEVTGRRRGSAGLPVGGVAFQDRPQERERIFRPFAHHGDAGQHHGGPGIGRADLQHPPRRSLRPRQVRSHRGEPGRGQEHIRMVRGEPAEGLQLPRGKF